MTGNLMKGLLFLLALHLSFTTQIIRSILGTYTLALDKLTVASLDTSPISSCTGAKSTSA